MDDAAGWLVTLPEVAEEAADFQRKAARPMVAARWVFAWFCSMPQRHQQHAWLSRSLTDAFPQVRMPMYHGNVYG